MRARYSLGGIAVVVTELLADRGQLLAQQVLPLLLLDPFGHVGSDLLVDLELGQVVLGPGQDQLDAGSHLGGLQDREAMIVRGLRPRGDEVGQCARLAGGAQDLRQAAGAAQGRDLLQHHPQLSDHCVHAGAGAAVGQAARPPASARCAH